MADQDPNLSRGNYAEYVDDYAAWIAGQIGLLRDGRYGELDLEHLIEEVESLARSDFNAFVSAIRIVLLHMLKWDIQEDRRSRSWINSINGHRERVTEELSDSPSYQSRIDEAIDRAYRRARPAAADQTGMPLHKFSPKCPYSWDEIQNRPHVLLNEST